MQHTRQKQDSINFLASLVSLKEEFSSVLAIGSNRDAALRKGMRSFFPLATWLSWKKHLEDDVTGKLDDLRVGDLDKKEFLLDMFRSDARKEMGLIDASSSQESLYHVWMNRKMEAWGLSKEAKTEFNPYFLTNVATDMKTTMIKSVGEKVGLGKNVFYNNDLESMNDRNKKRKGRGSHNLSWTECIDLLQSLSEEQEHNAERALLDKAPYRLCPYENPVSQLVVSLATAETNESFTVSFSSN